MLYKFLFFLDLVEVEIKSCVFFVCFGVCVEGEGGSRGFKWRWGVRDLVMWLLFFECFIYCIFGFDCYVYGRWFFFFKE